MDKTRAYLLAIFAGLAIAQTLATIQVHLSNSELSHHLQVLADAGYFTVPSPAVLDKAVELKAAFWGGLFFTVTIGAGMIMATLVVVSVWRRFFPDRRVFYMPLFLIWLFINIVVNSKGILAIETAYFSLLPAVVGIILWRNTPRGNALVSWRHSALPVMAVAVLALMWTTQFRDTMFLSVRDYLLLGNPIGQKINDYYYAYTLYPVNTFKRVDHQLLKSVNFRATDAGESKERVERSLRNLNYLDIGSRRDADITISIKDQMMFLSSGDKQVVSIPVAEFSADPLPGLTQFSEKTDRHRFFRTVCFYGLLIGFPLLLFSISYLSLSFIFGKLFGPVGASLATAVVCFIAGIALFWPVFKGNRYESGIQDVQTAIAADQWQTRVGALKRIHDQNMDLVEFPVYKDLLTTGNIPERYWLARALGKSRSPDTYADLLMLLDDPHPNVVCQAFYAIGARGNQKAVPIILKKIEKYDHWYAQGYGYRALRSLGWKQEKSRSIN
ncbi:MAG: HEAT repeat domain-containing protein [Desulfobacteraceae bacterium]|nr:HEAT repeat domain-containing protein [Desulfobacteraceae bacterium]